MHVSVRNVFKHYHNRLGLRNLSDHHIVITCLQNPTCSNVLENITHVAFIYHLLQHSIFLFIDLLTAESIESFSILQTRHQIIAAYKRWLLFSLAMATTCNINSVNVIVSGYGPLQCKATQLQFAYKLFTWDTIKRNYGYCDSVEESCTDGLNVVVYLIWFVHVHVCCATGFSHPHIGMVG